VKTYIKIAGSVVAFIIVAALVTPFLLNPNSYKSEISAQLEKQLARKVAIEGDIKLRLLPLPKVKVKDITVASVPGAKEPNLIQIGSLDISLKFWPLFKGHIDIDKIKLDRARIVLEQLPNEHVSWDVPVLSSEQQSSAPADKTPQKPSKVSLDIRKVHLKQCEVIYITPQTRQEIKDINFEVSLTSLKGPYEFTGSLEYGNQPLKMNGNIEAFADLIPAVLNIELFGQTVNLDGQINVDKKNFDGIVKVKGHTKDLQKLVPSLKHAEELLHEYKIKSNLSITDKKLTAKNIDLVYGNINAVGSASIDFDSLQSNAQLKINPGGASFVFSSQPKPNAIFNGSVTFAAQDLMVLLNALKIESVSLPKDFPRAFKVETDISYAKDHLTLSKILFNQGNAKFAGMFSQKTIKNQPIYQYEFKTPDLLPLAKIFMPDFTYDLGTVAVKGETSGSLDSLKTDTHFVAAQAYIGLKGDIRINETNQIAYNVAVSLNGPSLTSTLNSLNVDLGMKQLGKFQISTNVKGDSTHIAAQKLTGEVALRKSNLNWSGFAEAVINPIRPKVSATLSFGTINLDDLLAEAPRNYWDLLNDAKFMLVAKKDQSLPKHSTRWSHEKIDLSFLQNFDADFKMSASKIEYGSFVFKDLQGTTKLVNGVLEIPQITAQTYGGTVSLKGRASSQQSQPINVKLTMTNANLKEIAPQKGTITITGGHMNLQAELNSFGTSEFEYVKNLAGSINMKAQKGIITGFNLQRINEQLNKLNNLASVVKLLNASFEGGQTHFESLDGTLSINDGVVRITQMNLLAQGATANATGKINLPAYTLSVDTNVKLSDSKLPPFGVRFYGSLDNPQHELDAGELQQYLVENVFKNVIQDVVKGKGKPARLVKDILGIGNQDTTAPNQPDAQKPKDANPTEIVKEPAKALDTIIKGLL
jgi:AsmA protein